MGRMCAICGCSNSTFKLDDWYAGLCKIHGVRLGGCVCKPPFILFPFPSEKKNPEGRNRWNKLVNRKTKSGKNWTASYQDRVCSVHFKNGEPTAAWPDPTENMGYDHATKRPRNPPKVRPPYSEVMGKVKKRKKELASSIINTTGCVEEEPIDRQQTVEVEIPIESSASTFCLQDHDYMQQTYATAQTSCLSCSEKELVIEELQSKVKKLTNKANKIHRKHFDMAKVVLKSDRQ
ncbi:uncharacterized protein LOC117122991 [Anneissia japonica]|uniref:uncharacterized protein LOC117122991 n=1 Tax=Anneissia japonica TaxID=1529436 RepID=UPI001425572E|nr:uncharacterized protein LOC117122991 [Anneissia japonica]XP_033124668.1 uncharacterized protein LOC117122991 [Anneissia japonica]XP_033124669.1 uncharacterized protein LOC117122991 [Anneissia japonica]